MTTLKVRDVMTTQGVTLKPTDTVRKATLRFAVDGISGAPVVDNRNHVLGIVTENDILNLILKYQKKIDELETGVHNLLGGYMDSEITDEIVAEANEKISSTKIEDIMARSVLVTTTDAELIEVLATMMNLDVNRLPVLEQGVLVGTISRSDIIFYIYKKKV